MSWLFALGGILLIGVAMIDALWTTLTLAGGGPLTSRIAQTMWRGALWVQRRAASERHRMLLFLGTLILMMVMLVWIVLLWAGWTLLFSADTSAVVASQTGVPADLWARVYFTGYTLFTLGVGNFVPQGGLWEVLTAVASLNGLTLVTLSITYLVPVLSAVTSKRRLAAAAYDLGPTASEVARRAWSGSDFQGLSNHLAQLTPMIEQHSQQHAAYPILHYFHSTTRRTAPGPSLAALDEALTLLTYGVQPRSRPTSAETEPARSAIAGLLRTLEDQYIQKADDPPPIPDLSVLRDTGIPVVDQEEFVATVRSLSHRRRVLRALVESDGWTWDAVCSRQVDPPMEAATSS